MKGGDANTHEFQRAQLIVGETVGKAIKLNLDGKRPQVERGSGHGGGNCGNNDQTTTKSDFPENDEPQKPRR